MSEYQKQLAAEIDSKFGNSKDLGFRMRKFLEEAIELYQSLGGSEFNAGCLVAKVYRGNPGIPELEAGDAAAALSSLLNAYGIDDEDAKVTGLNNLMCK